MVRQLMSLRASLTVVNMSDKPRMPQDVRKERFVRQVTEVHTLGQLALQELSEAEAEVVITRVEV